MKALRLASYMFALAVMAITAPLTVGADRQGIVVSVLGGTLALTPYVVVRAIEEHLRSQRPSRCRSSRLEKS